VSTCASNQPATAPAGTPGAPDGEPHPHPRVCRVIDECRTSSERMHASTSGGGPTASGLTSPWGSVSRLRASADNPRWAKEISPRDHAPTK
jgi:hypothetical protein